MALVLVVAIGAPRTRRCRLVVAAAATLLLGVLMPQAQRRGCCLLRLLGSERGASLVRERL